MKQVLSICAGVALAATVSCHRTPDESAAKIIAGTVVDRSDYPHCAMLIQGNALCTGTFVNDTTVLTANHCVDRADSTGGVKITINGTDVYSQNVFFSFGYDRANDGNARSIRMYDIAVLVFPEGTGTSLGIQTYPRVSNRAPRVGERVVIMGYGDTSFDPNVDDYGVLRRGRMDPITAISAENFQIDGFLGTGSWVGPGDSGGASYNAAGEIVGVASQGGVADSIGQARGNFKNLLGPNSTEVFERAINCSNAPCAQEFRPGRSGDGPTPPVGGNGTSLGVIIGEGVDALDRVFVVFKSLTPGGAAESAGIHVGDVIYTVNGLPVRSVTAVQQVLRMSGGVANIVVYRNGQPMAFNGIQLQ